jgi:hypothetical protein
MRCCHSQTTKDMFCTYLKDVLARDGSVVVHVFRFEAFAKFVDLELWTSLNGDLEF